MPVPHPVAYLAADALWSTGVGDAPGGFVDYVRYPFVADGEKARRELGFVARATRAARPSSVSALSPSAGPRARRRQAGA